MTESLSDKPPEGAVNVADCGEGCILVVPSFVAGRRLSTFSPAAIHISLLWLHRRHLLQDSILP